MAFSPQQFISIHLELVSTKYSQAPALKPSLSLSPSFPMNFCYPMLAAQEVIQAKGGHFIKVTGVKQVADSLVISQT